MKLFTIFLAAVLVMAWLGTTAGHWMNRHVKARAIAMEEKAR